LDEKTLVFGKKSAPPESLFLTTFFLEEKKAEQNGTSGAGK